MKVLAITLNAVLFAIIVFAVIDGGMPEDKYFWFVLLMLAAPVSSITALLRGPNADGLIATFIERKKLEEKKKIQGLRHTTENH